MKPDPTTYVRTARRQLLALAEGLPAMEGLALSRLAEGLARLEFLVSTEGRTVADGYRDRYQSLTQRADGPSDETLSRRQDLPGARAQLAQTLAGRDAANGLLDAAADLDAELLREVRAATADLMRTNAGCAQDLEWPALTPERLTGFLRSFVPELAAVSVANVTRVAGLSANEAYLIDLADSGPWPAKVVLRRGRKAAIQQHPVSHEFPILQALHAHDDRVPAPLLMTEGSELDAPVIIVARLTGSPETLTTQAERGVRLTLDMSALLARYHTLDPAALPHWRRSDGRSLAEWTRRRIDGFEADWRRYATDPSFVVDAAFAWLKRNVGAITDRSVIVHGDFDQRNVLIDGDRISGVIDWEMAHEGHPAEDLSYIRPQVEALMPWDRFLDHYLAHGGRPVSEDQLRFGEVIGNLGRLTTSMTAYGTFVAGEHEDIVLGTVGTIELERFIADLHRLTRTDLECAQCP